MASEKQAEYIKSMVVNLQNAPYLQSAPDANKKRWMEDVMRLPTHDDDDNTIRRSLEEVQAEYGNRINAILEADFEAMSSAVASTLINALKAKHLPA